MNHRKLKSLAIKEIKALKKHAKPEELANLNFETFNPEWAENCIYGQMTGFCFGLRASELIGKCAPLLVIKEETSRTLEDCKLNGKPTKVLLKNRSHTMHFSPIESFIWMSENRTNGNNERIIQYLRGDVNKLELK